MTDDEVRREVKAAIRFYEARGRNWLDVVTFILTKHQGIPIVVQPWWRRSGRPRKRRGN